jgi:ferredoxin
LNELIKSGIIMAIKKVWIEEGCTACGLCEDIAPDVFKVEDEAVVLDGADLNANEEGIKESAEECPVEVIMFEEE